MPPIYLISAVSVNRKVDMISSAILSSKVISDRKASWLAVFKTTACELDEVVITLFALGGLATGSSIDSCIVKFATLTLLITESID
jgi:hypothetical protein